MTVTREQFVAEARTWLDTPFQHQGRIKGVACDCVGLVICTARALGLSEFEMTDYGRRPDGRLRPMLDLHMDAIPPAEAQAADVLLFAWNASPIHVGILTDPEHLIHAFVPNRKVIETLIDSRMRALIVGAFRVPGVA